MRRMGWAGWHYLGFGVAFFALGLRTTDPRHWTIGMIMAFVCGLCLLVGLLDGSHAQSPRKD